MFQLFADCALWPVERVILWSPCLTYTWSDQLQVLLLLYRFYYTNWRSTNKTEEIFFQGIISFLFIVVGDIEALIEFASFLIWVAYGSAFVALLVLRRTQPDIPRPYKVPIIIPYFALFVAIFLSAMPIISEPSVKYLVALAFIFSGIAVYTPFVYHKIRPKLMSKKFLIRSEVLIESKKKFFSDKFTYLLQVLFEAAPPPKELWRRSK